MAFKNSRNSREKIKRLSRSDDSALRLLPIMTALLFAVAVSFGGWKFLTTQGWIRWVAPADVKLAREILANPDLRKARTKMQEILGDGLAAGGHYKEIWIRDLNTFIETALNQHNRLGFREALLMFLDFQGEDGDIVDGIVLKKDALSGYQYIRSKHHSDRLGFKNTVATDQESSLILAFSHYIRLTGDYAILQEFRHGRSVLSRLESAMTYLLNERTDPKTQLLWGGTTSDWGDVQPETPQGILLDQHSHRAIDIYDNAMFILALNALVNWLPPAISERVLWEHRLKAHLQNTRQHLWDTEHQKFIPHIYLTKSPFPLEFDEKRIHFHGGTAVAIEAGLLKKHEVQKAHAHLRQSIENVKAQTVSLTIEPAYPNGFFRNPIMKNHEYQNGGEWDWFGCRWVTQLTQNDLVQAAYDDIQPIAKRQLRVGFYEWFTLKGEPRGAAYFKGSAGVCSQAIDALDNWARERRERFVWIGPH